MKFQNVTIATIFIRLINHLEIVIDIKYQYYQTIFRYKKAFLRFGCLCSNATVALGVFIDLKKAFDTVDHTILLEKMKFYGVRGETAKLLESYLSRWMQYVCYGGFESEKGLVECRVPEGSVLGPLFFLIYVNDMVRACSDLDLVLFADDTNIFAKARNSDELFQKVNKGLQELRNGLDVISLR